MTARRALALALATGCAASPAAPTPPTVAGTPPAPATTQAPTTTAAPAVTAPPPSSPTTGAGRAVGATTTPTVAVDQPEGMEGAQAQLDAIARCEGYPAYVNRDHPGASSASGKYGVLDGTWDGYAGYESAADAPEAVQDEWAREAYARAGTRPWRASRSCWGRG